MSISTPSYIDQLKTVLKSCDQNKEIILIGDFNINWDDKHGRRNLSDPRIISI